VTGRLPLTDHVIHHGVEEQKDVVEVPLDGLVRARPRASERGRLEREQAQSVRATQSPAIGLRSNATSTWLAGSLAMPKTGFCGNAFATSEGNGWKVRTSCTLRSPRTHVNGRPFMEGR
jgi:hypothetical protein